MVVLGVVVLAMVVAPADASDDWDALLPDEYGISLFVVPAVNEDERGLATLSWQAFSVNDWGAYATVLRPYYQPGFGADAGITRRKIRFGVGYVDEDTWGIYLRRAF